MNKKAVITGATSGIGASFAKKLASMGFDLVLTGRRKEIIETLADELSRHYQVEAQVILAELSDETALKKVVAAVKGMIGIEYLINNAGYGLNKNFYENDIESEEKMVKVHVLAPMELIRAAVPEMIKNGKGYIINVSSVAAFMSLPRNASYCGSKSFMTLFTESIHMELMNKGIRVQSLCPGFTRTDFHEKMKMDQKEWERLQVFNWMKPDEVVEYSLKCLRKKRVVCIPGFWNRVTVKLIRMIPRALYYKVNSSFGESFSPTKPPQKNP